MKMRTDRYFKMSDGEREIVWRRLYNVLHNRRANYLPEAFNEPIDFFFQEALYEAEQAEQFALCQAIIDAADFFEIDMEYNGSKPLDK